MRLVAIAIHFLRTYYVPRFQNEAPAFPFPCSYQPLLLHIPTTLVLKKPGPHCHAWN